MTDALEPAMDRVVRNLLTKWQYLRYVPSQALEAVRSAAQVTLTDDSAAAVAVMLEELSRLGDADGPPPGEAGILEMFLRTVLAEEFEAIRRQSCPAGRRPIDAFLFRLVFSPGTNANTGAARQLDLWEEA